MNRAGLLSDVHIRYIMYQICKAVAFIHSGGVVHRDLKPNNVLINEDSLVKLCDFGLARSVHGGDEVRLLFCTAGKGHARPLPPPHQPLVYLFLTLHF